MSAVLVEAGVDEGAVWHYGDPLREGRALEQGRALVDLASLSVIKVAGSTRLQWLHLFLTQACDHAQPGESVDALILTPNGHIEFGLHVVDDGRAAWIITDRATKAALLDYLKMMVFTYDVTITDANEDYCVLGGLGEPPAIADATVTWHAGASFATIDPTLDKYVPQRPAVWPAYELVVPRSVVEGLLAEHGAAGMWAWEAARIAAGVPRVVVDADHRNLPHELGLIGEAVHLRKGCYRGQEAIARTYNLGKPPRVLVLLHLDGTSEQLPAAGAQVSIEGADIGQLTSSARHHELGSIALAVVKREFDAAAVAEVEGGFTASVQPVVVVPDQVNPVVQFRREMRANVSALNGERAATPPSPPA